MLKRLPELLLAGYDKKAMYYSAIFFDKERAEKELPGLASRRKVFDPRQALEPPSAKELRKSGKIKTVREWKKNYWGTEGVSEEKIRDVRGGKVLSFSSEDCPQGLLRALTSSGCAVSISEDGSDIRGFVAGDSWKGAREAFRREEELRGMSLWELLDGRMRADGKIKRRDFERLRSGQPVWAEFPWGKESLQRDLFGGPSAQVIFDDTEPLDDVLFVRRGKSGLWVDLLCR